MAPQGLINYKQRLIVTAQTAVATRKAAREAGLLMGRWVGGVSSPGVRRQEEKAVTQAGIAHASVRTDRIGGL